jgi:formylglycine-generating enzyme required for sulfatase activity
LGVFPVLVGEYQALMGLLPSAASLPAPSRGLFGIFKQPVAQVFANIPSNPLLPVTQVSYDEAQAFVDRLTEATGEAYRIPSEAEWEYACRAGSRTRYHCGDTIDSTRAAFSFVDGPLEPGSFPPNAFASTRCTETFGNGRPISGMSRMTLRRRTAGLRRKDMGPCG